MRDVNWLAILTMLLLIAGVVLPELSHPAMGLSAGLAGIGVALLVVADKIDALLNDKKDGRK